MTSLFGSATKRFTLRFTAPKDSQNNLRAICQADAKKWQPRYARRPRGQVFPSDRSIYERPDYVKSRETFGEWEGDLKNFERSQGTMNAASLIERKTRFAVLFRNNDRSSTHFINKLMDVMEPLPQPTRKSITFDRGFEFRAWRKLESGIDTDSWFCDPQAPW
ncbi:IS30 family transposase [uncultured Tateyamaria sp.]|uniref:IS30 family transposase n=1 Tax=uncultured Tateyamaria sp. TaxID=455651 RepID=UPI00261A67DA|nr:IS30 family transposase [uncultured Tateyamaria sp.]